MAIEETGAPILGIKNVARRGRRFLSDEQRQQREGQIICLRQEGRSNSAIAEALGLSLSTVKTVVRKLIREGRLKPQPRGRAAGFQREDVSWRNEQSERVQLIIKLKKQHATHKEIGAVLGVTSERVRQLIKKVAAEHGRDIFMSEEPIWTVREASEELKTSAQTIVSLCSQGKIPYRRRSLNKWSHYLLSQESMNDLKRHPRITGDRICSVCNCHFIHIPGKFKHVVCSQECADNYKRVEREKTLLQEPTVENLEGWRKDLWQRLKTHKPPKKERWLTLSQASELTGLSKMQVEWLGMRRIVTVSEHPTKRWHGRPAIGYAASEMEIARRAYSASRGQ